MLPTGSCSVLGLVTAKAGRNRERTHAFPHLVLLNELMSAPSIKKLSGDFPGCTCLVQGEDPGGRLTLCPVLLSPVLFNRGRESCKAGRAPAEGLCPKKRKAFLTISSWEKAEDFYTLAPTCCKHNDVTNSI